MSKFFAWVATAAMMAAVATNVSAQQKLVVAGYGGSFEDIMRKDIFPPFEKNMALKLIL